MAITNPEKAELIADSLRSQFTPNHDILDLNTFSQVIPRVEQLNNSAIHNTLDPISTTEITNFINKLKKNKSPGEDKINAKMLINLPINFIIFITFLLNSLLKLNHFPTHWKNAVVVPIPKPGMDHTIPSNFRPISLLSSLSKVYESILATRFDDFCNEQNILKPEQFGFRKQHSTQHQLLRVVELLQDQITRKRVAGVVFVDIAKAFDKIWIDGLLFKLINLNFPTQLIKILNSYLNNRTFIVKANNCYSSPRPIFSGVPQGSLLGPKLFNIYINDMPNSPNIDLALYADDTAIIARHVHARGAFYAIKNYLKIYEVWLTQWRIKVNTSKCAAVFYTHKSVKDFTHHNNLTLNKEIIPWETSYKYLGVILDSKLTWKQHILTVAKRARAAQGTLKPFLNYHSRLSPKTKLLLYKSFIRPIMTYGSAVWGTAAIAHLRNLQVIQNNILKICVSFPFYVRNDLLHRDLGVRPIIPEFKKLATKFHQNILKINNPVLHNLPVYDPTNCGSSKRPRGLLFRSDMDLPPSKKRSRYAVYI
jgi:hypothetical protein